LILTIFGPLVGLSTKQSLPQTAAWSDF